jgi:hypothetical protein
MTTETNGQSHTTYPKHTSLPVTEARARVDSYDKSSPTLAHCRHPPRQSRQIGQQTRLSLLS